MSILSKLFYNCNATLIKISFSKIHVERQGNKTTKTILKKKNKVGGVTLSEFLWKMYLYFIFHHLNLSYSLHILTTQYISIVIKTVWYKKERHIYQWSKNRVQKQNHTSTASYLLNEGTNKSMEKGEFFSKWCWNNWSSIHTHTKVNLNLNLTLYTKLNTKWIIKISISQKNYITFRIKKEKNSL